MDVDVPSPIVSSLDHTSSMHDCASPEGLDFSSARGRQHRYSGGREYHQAR